MINQLYHSKECQSKTKQLSNEHCGKDDINQLDVQMEENELNWHEASQNQSKDQESEKTKDSLIRRGVRYKLRDYHFQQTRAKVMSSCEQKKEDK